MKTSAKQNVLCYNFYVCDRITEIEDFEIIMKRSRKRNIIIEGILVIFAFIAALLLLSAHWAFSNWSSLTVEEIYFQLIKRGCPCSGHRGGTHRSTLSSPEEKPAAQGNPAGHRCLRGRNAYRRRLCLGRTGFYQLSCQPRQRLYLY